MKFDTRDVRIPLIGKVLLSLTTISYSVLLLTRYRVQFACHKGNISIEVKVDRCFLSSESRSRLLWRSHVLLSSSPLCPPPSTSSTSRESTAVRPRPQPCFRKHTPDWIPKTVPLVCSQVGRSSRINVTVLKLYFTTMAYGLGMVETNFCVQDCPSSHVQKALGYVLSKVNFGPSDSAWNR